MDKTSKRQIIMNAQSFMYPTMPSGIDKKIIEPSSQFKTKVLTVTLTIVFFLVIYFVLVAAACGLAFLCAYAGIHLIAGITTLVTIMIGLGLIGLGVMVLFFFLKFIFKQNKVDRSGLILLNEKDQPQLFEFIRRLTKETGTPFPKKIYVSPEVNAAVFYDSNFWSMFFPVRKNLLIGLGLVNSINLSEFKAILAHEFGHFSQSSMKFGSYVYNVNKVIYNMLFENDSYGNALQTWASASGYFAIFAQLTIKIVQGIQWIMQKVYIVVNKSYLGLSRQMEFHADTVAAYVSGSNPLIMSLLRLEPADICYNKLIDQCDLWIKENYKSENIYPQHTEVMQHFATDFNIPVKSGFMQLTEAKLYFFEQSRLVIKDQWASHPSTRDRIKHLAGLNIKSETINVPAWSIFNNAEGLQQQITNKIYAHVKYDKEPQIIDSTAFRSKYYDEVNKNTYNKAYCGFYDGREILEFDPQEVAKDDKIADIETWDEILKHSKEDT
jgi:Zn-dependent protease with chaperone function